MLLQWSSDKSAKSGYNNTLPMLEMKMKDTAIQPEAQAILEPTGTVCETKNRTFIMDGWDLSEGHLKRTKTHCALR